MTTGDLRKLAFNHPKIGVKVWQYAFERFGGQQFRSMYLSPEAKKQADQDSFYDKPAEDRSSPKLS